MRVRESAGWFLGALLLLGCGSSDDEQDTDLAGGCDIRTAGCQRATFAAAARVHGQVEAPMPPVHTISLQEFEALFTSEDPAAGEPDPWNDALSLLGLLPANSSVDDEVAASSVANVAAFYDPDTKEVTVIDRGGASDPLDDVFILAHEFVHFLQDSQRPLEPFREQWVESLDSFVAVTSLIEGEANVLGLGVVAEALDATPASLNWAAANASLRSGAFDAIEVSTAPFITALQILPYPLGTAQLAPLMLAGGTGALEPLYEAPRLSVLDWAEDTRVTEPSRLEPLDCEPSAGPAGFVGYDRDSFGPAGILAILMRGGRQTESAWQAALGFRGDRVVLFEEEGAPGSFAVAWRIRFTTESAATAFTTYAQGALATGTVTSDGREVLLHATTDAQKLAPWLEIGHCGTPDELPERRVEPAEENSSLRRKLRRAHPRDWR
jgi:hypothetical protein